MQINDIERYGPRVYMCCRELFLLLAFVRITHKFNRYTAGVAMPRAEMTILGFIGRVTHPRAIL